MYENLETSHDYIRYYKLSFLQAQSGSKTPASSASLSIFDYSNPQYPATEFRTRLQPRGSWMKPLAMGAPPREGNHGPDSSGVSRLKEFFSSHRLSNVPRAFKKFLIPPAAWSPTVQVISSFILSRSEWACGRRGPQQTMIPVPCYYKTEI